jgi:hypothetical protein
MKKFFSSFIFLAVFASSASAKVWRVNSNTGVVADFSSMTNAVTAAAAGDTIYLESNTLSSFTLNKRLTIIGSGYFLGSGENTGLQANTAASGFGTVTISDSAASGSVFIGLSFGNVTFSGAGAGADNVTVSKCYFSGFTTSGTLPAGAVAKDWVITKCYTYSSWNLAALVIDNWNISNNIIAAAMTLSNTANKPFVVRNNTMPGSGTNTFYNAYFANNILQNGTYNFFASLLKNNVSIGTITGYSTFVGSNGNKGGFTAAQVFVPVSGNSSDGRYRLASGSPAIGAGLTVGSVVNPDAGAFGGPDPYVLSGMPPIPAIYSYSVQDTIQSGQPVNVKFSTRSN